MPVPGYDPQDVERLIETSITDNFSDGELAERLPADALERFEEGERLVDVLDQGTIDELLEERVFG